MSLITWDNAAIALALLAVLLRLADYPRPATIASSVAVLCATCAQRLARRRPEQTRV